MTKSTKDRHRLSFFVTGRVRDQLERVTTEGECETYTEALRRALDAYEWVLKTQKSGAHIVVKKSNGTEEKVRFL